MLAIYGSMLTEHTHAPFVLQCECFQYTPRYGPLIFEMKYETKINIMSYAAFITGNLQKLFAKRNTYGYSQK